MTQQTNFKNHDVLVTNSKKVACDGSSPASKHPLVYLYMGENDFVVCPYCSKHFSLSKTIKISNKTKKN